MLPLCHEARVPVTAGRRSQRGVRGLASRSSAGWPSTCAGWPGIVDVDDDVAAGRRPGRHLRPRPRSRTADAHGVTLGHWPQSMDLSTVGGWLACRGAGQYSTRYGKIEDMVVGLEVALADGRVIRTGGHGAAVGHRARPHPALRRAARAPSGSSPRAGFRVHPVPAAEGRRAFGFAAFADGLEACRRILRRGATPAVLRLYDATESARSLRHARRLPSSSSSTRATRAWSTPRWPWSTTSARGRRPARRRAGRALAGHRNDVSALAPLWRAGIVVDTIEIAGPLGGAARPLRRSASTPSAASRAPWPPRPTSPTPTPTAPASTSPSPAAARGDGRPAADDEPGPRRYYRRAWDAVIGRHHGRRRGHQPPSRHRAQPGAASWPSPRRRLRRAGRGQGRPSTPAASSTRASSACPRPFGDGAGWP